MTTLKALDRLKDSVLVTPLLMIPKQDVLDLIDALRQEIVAGQFVCPTCREIGLPSIYGDCTACANAKRGAG